LRKNEVERTDELKQLQERTAEQCSERHTETPVRIYSDDNLHAMRVERSRRGVVGALKAMGQTIPHSWRKIVEVGCGMADISGWFSQGHHVMGIESAPRVALECQKRWPWMTVVVADVQKAEPIDCDLVILCEILEHLHDPKGIAERWLKKARYCLITSPLEEDSAKNLSSGEHSWSFTMGDLHEFFVLGEHTMEYKELVEAGQLTIFLGIGKRMEAA